MNDQILPPRGEPHRKTDDLPPVVTGRPTKATANSSVAIDDVSEPPAQISNEVEDLPTIGFVILEKPHGDPARTIRSIGENHPSVFVTYSGDSAPGETARSAGAIVVKMRGENEAPPARARNAGFRQLRKIEPNIEYVHFLDAGLTLDPRWLHRAARFLEDRPEIAALEGAVHPSGGKPGKQGQPRDQEIQSTGDNVLVRVNNFVNLGGLRGDLAVADIQDFCLRTRGRGRHIWFLDSPMLASTQKKKAPLKWWRSRRQQGFDHAFAAALHGGAPEYFRVQDRRRAIFWGFLFPASVLTLAASITYLTYDVIPFGIPILWGGLVVLTGLLVLFIKTALDRPDPRDRDKVFMGKLDKTLSHIPEFVGVVDFLRWRRKSRARNGRE